MNPITPLNNWVLQKIINYLTQKEGFIIDSSEFTIKGMKASIQDAFGYRYEVEIKTVARINTETGSNEYTHGSNPLVSADIIKKA